MSMRARAAILCALALAGCRSVDDRAAIESLARKWIDAWAGGDYGDVLACIAPADRARFVGGMARITLDARLPDVEQDRWARQDLDRTLDKHGIEYTWDKLYGPLSIGRRGAARHRHPLDGRTTSFHYEVEGVRGEHMESPRASPAKGKPVDAGQDHGDLEWPTEFEDLQNCASPRRKPRFWETSRGFASASRSLSSAYRWRCSSVGFAGAPRWSQRPSCSWLSPTLPCT